MYCSKCGKEVPSDAKFCANCGASIEQDATDSISQAPDEETKEPSKDDLKNNDLSFKKIKNNWNDKYAISVIIVGMIIAAILGFAVKKINHQRDFSDENDLEITNYEGDSVTPDDGIGDDGSEGDEVPPENDFEEEFLTYIQDTYSDNAAEYQGNIYAIFNIKEENLESWDECETFCESMDGHLAVISTEDENEFIYQYIKENGLKISFFGYTDQYSEGDWEWVTGEDSGYTNWAYGQPNNGKNNKNKKKEDYAEFFESTGDGTWNDAPFGSNTHHFICEWEGEW